MRRVSGHHQAQSAASSTSPMANSDITVHFPSESDVQASVFPEVFARVEYKFNHFRTVNHDPGARVAAIYSIDKEIDEQLKAVDAARQLLHSQLARRNTLAPISLLPPEILARVFHFLVLKDSIRATYVCQFWRQVALDDSSLWAKISSTSENTKLISEMLVRAKNAPLDIYICLRSWSGREMLRIFPPHLSHTRELRLYGLLRTIHSNSIQDICSREAPALEHFELGSSFNSLITFRELEGTALFKGRTPRLRTLCLSQVLFPWSHIPRGQLTQITIHLFKELPASYAPLYGDLNQLVNLLVGCPELKILVLDRCLPFQLTEITYGQTIHLPHLSLLNLAGSGSRIMNLMKMLKLPPSTRLYLRCTSENTPTYNDSLFLSVVAAQFSGPVPVEFKSLSVTISSTDNLIEVAASTTLPSWRSCQTKDFDGDVDNNPELVLSFNGLPELGYWTDRLGQVCKMLPISDLEFLSLSASDILNSLIWVELFKRCTKLIMMQAIGQGASSLVRALTTPKLTNMRADKSEKKRKRDDRDTLKKLDFTENDHTTGILFNIVEKGLQQRIAVSKAPLGMFHIENCVINARHANALETLVEEFHWDGKEVFDRYEDNSDSYSD